ncbi:hypothetical protein TI05_03710 [Achromatium sp. WMS3]|nr:hypothetical protein TI05_03710 [Achromatium sp. WMS3]
MTQPTFVINYLDDLTLKYTNRFGGKTLGLSKLIAVGAAVPKGIAITATTDLPDIWPQDVKTQLEHMVQYIFEQGQLIVRSSSLVEDGTQHSFAGLFETIPGVTNLTKLWNAIADCIASGSSKRVLSYSGVHKALPVGILIQQQIAPKVAGVCFTQDPTGQDYGLIIEAVAGLGEALVSGHTNPQRWRIYISGLDQYEVIEETSHNESLLGLAQLQGLAKKAWDLATALGYPLDLEWAIDDNEKLWWLQARPITTGHLPPKWRIERACNEVDDGPVTLWSNMNVRETMPDPYCPLTWDIWRSCIIPQIVSDLCGVPVNANIIQHLLPIDLVQGRVYFNVNGLLAMPLVGRLFRYTMEGIDKQALMVVNDLTNRGILQLRSLPGWNFSMMLRMVPANILAATRLLSVMQPRKSRHLLKQIANRIKSRPPVQQLTDSELITEIRLPEHPIAIPLLRGLQMEVVALLVWMLTDRAFAKWPQAQRLITSGIPGNPTTEISLNIDLLIEAARPLKKIFQNYEPGQEQELLQTLKQIPESQAWYAKLQTFLKQYGHRGPKEFDLITPRWHDDPSMIIALVKSGLDIPSEMSATHRMASLNRERTDAITAAITQAPWWQRPWLKFLAHALTLYMPLREAPKHEYLHVFARMRQAALELGHRLTKRGILTSASQVFMLKLDELSGLNDIAAVTENTHQPLAHINIQELITKRNQQLADFTTHKAPDFLRSDGIPIILPKVSSQEEPGVLHGLGISDGIVTGQVKILTEADPNALMPGEILVVKFADPGWTPLFPRAAAIIVEVGGLMCHAAVVARELGIPAVFGVAGVTEKLQTGQTVQVNALTGKINVRRENASS